MVWVYVFSWGVYASTTLDHIIKPLYVHLMQEENRNMEMVRYLTQKHMEFTSELEKFLEGRLYICGKK